MAKGEKVSLDSKKKAFALHLYKTGRKKDSAIKAGYSEGGAAVAANRLSKDPYVIAELERLQGNREKAQAPETISKPEISDLSDSEEIKVQEPKTFADVVLEVEKIAFLDIPEGGGAAAVITSKLSALKNLQDLAEKQTERDNIKRLSAELFERFGAGAIRINLSCKQNLSCEGFEVSQIDNYKAAIIENELHDVVNKFEPDLSFPVGAERQTELYALVCSDIAKGYVYTDSEFLSGLIEKNGRLSRVRSGFGIAPVYDAFNNLSYETRDYTSVLHDNISKYER